MREYIWGAKRTCRRIWWQANYPPDEDYKNINIIEVEDEPEYFIEYELWVDGEKSDLTLSCTVQFIEDEVRIMIENIHVL